MAKHHTHFALGLMCGSSMDGMDMAYCRFENRNGKWQWQVLAIRAASYRPAVLRQLKNLNHSTPAALLEATAVFSRAQAADVNRFLAENKLPKPDLIAWHGHTLSHRPDLKLTFQMGDGAMMAQHTQVPVITALRANDMLLGGQGAPIVPIGDKHLFAAYPLLLNLGGIANITAKVHSKLFAFDICPLNQVLNHFAMKKNKPYDRGGRLASQGMALSPLLKKLSALDYFRKPYPKSLDNSYTARVLQILDRKSITVENALATYCELAAIQIAKHIAAVERREKVSFHRSKLFITGGGAFNTHLLQRIAHHTKLNIVVPDENIVKFKEAIVMAFIGVLRMANTPNVLASVTGALRDSVNGEVHFPLLQQ